MTTAQELKERYDGLYDYMADSRDPPLPDVLEINGVKYKKVRE